MARVIADLLRDSEYHSDRNGARIVRACYVEIDADANRPGYSYLLQGLFTQGMPQQGERHPIRTDCVCTGHDIKFVQNGNEKQTYVGVIYETPTLRSGQPGGPTSNKFFARDTSSLHSETSEIDPVAKEPIQCRYKNAADSNDKSGRTIPGSISVLRPLRTFIVGGTFDKRPDESLLKAFGSVNRVDWQGQKPGFWLFSGLNVDTRDAGTTYEVTCNFTSRVVRDWASFYIAQDHTGHHVQISQTRLAQALNEPYSPGTSQYNGFALFRPYPVADFQSLFGI